MSLQQFCERPLITVSPAQTISEACQLLQDKNIGCLVAVENGTLCGILTDRDIALKVTGAGKDPRQTTVREVMTANPARIPVNKNLSDLTELMHAFHVRRVPIVDGGNKPLGLVTLDDLLVLLGKEMSDVGDSVSATLFRKPARSEEEAPMEWIISYP
jgi:CBS domain-containing protein